MFIVYTDNICSTRPDEEFHFKIYFKMLWVVKLSNAETLFFFPPNVCDNLPVIHLDSWGSNPLVLGWKLKRKIYFLFLNSEHLLRFFFTENCKISLELKCAEIVFYSLEYKYKIFACHLYFRFDHINLADENEPLGLTRLIFSRINSIYIIYCCLKIVICRELLFKSVFK